MALAVLFCWSPLVSLLLLPLFVTLNMIPKVALGPLFIVWFSYGIFPNILIAFSICFFPILLTTARGLSEVEPGPAGPREIAARLALDACSARSSCPARCPTCSPA